MTALRIFFIGGGISYRALFNWISPWHYIPTMLGSPLFVLIFFTYLGRFTDVEDESFFVRCDDELNPPAGQALGRLVALVGVAPAEPLEYLVLRITQDAEGHVEVVAEHG